MKSTTEKYVSKLFISPPLALPNISNRTIILTTNHRLSRTTYYVLDHSLVILTHIIVPNMTTNISINHSQHTSTFSTSQLNLWPQGTLRQGSLTIKHKTLSEDRIYLGIHITYTTLTSRLLRIQTTLFLINSKSSTLGLHLKHYISIWATLFRNHLTNETHTHFTQHNEVIIYMLP